MTRIKQISPESATGKSRELLEGVHVTAGDIEEVRRTGYDDAVITEVIAQVALCTFANDFNNVANTANDFPMAPVL